MPKFKSLATVVIVGVGLTGCITIDMPEFAKSDKNNKQSNSTLAAQSPQYTSGGVATPVNWDNGAMYVEEKKTPSGAILQGSDEYSLNSSSTYAQLAPFKSGTSATDFLLPSQKGKGRGAGPVLEWESEEDLPVWYIDKGDRLCDTLTDWARVANQNAFCRDTSLDWEAEVSGEFKGTFNDAVQWLVAGFKYADDYRPKALKYDNAYEIYSVEAR